MFTFGSQTTTSQLTSDKQNYDNICLDILSRNNYRALNKIKQIKTNLDNFYDEFKNNFLHISVRSCNYDLSKTLITLIDKKKRNSFNESPLDIAIQKNDVEMVKILLVEDQNVLRNEINYVLSENKLIKNQNDELEKLNRKFIQDNIIMTKKYNEVVVKYDMEIKSNKRLRADFEYNQQDIKRFKTDNDKLKIDNNVLKETIKNLRQDSKK